MKFPKLIISLVAVSLFFIVLILPSFYEIQDYSDTMYSDSENISARYRISYDKGKTYSKYYSAIDSNTLINASDVIFDIEIDSYDSANPNSVFKFVVGNARLYETYNNDPRSIYKADFVGGDNQTNSYLFDDVFHYNIVPGTNQHFVLQAKRYSSSAPITIRNASVLSKHQKFGEDTSRVAEGIFLSALILTNAVIFAILVKFSNKKTTYIVSYLLMSFCIYALFIIRLNQTNYFLFNNFFFWKRIEYVFFFLLILITSLFIYYMEEGLSKKVARALTYFTEIMFIIFVYNNYADNAVLPIIFILTLVSTLCFIALAVSFFKKSGVRKKNQNDIFDWYIISSQFYSFTLSTVAYSVFGLFLSLGTITYLEFISYTSYIFTVYAIFSVTVSYCLMYFILINKRRAEQLARSETQNFQHQYGFKEQLFNFSETETIVESGFKDFDRVLNGRCLGYVLAEKFHENKFTAFVYNNKTHLAYVDVPQAKKDKILEGFYDSDTCQLLYFDTCTLQHTKYTFFVAARTNYLDTSVHLDKVVINIWANLAKSYLSLNDIKRHESSVLYNLTMIGEKRSKETGSHLKRVASYSYLIGKKFGLSDEDLQILSESSVMHDIGKLSTPKSILQKPGKLTPEEFDIVKHHASAGFIILQNCNSILLKEAKNIALYHHEKYNGKGYYGLKGKNIPLFSRITSIADVFDALYTERSYKKPWPIEKIITLFEEEKGEHFDPVLADIFLDNVDEFLEIFEASK